MPELYQESSDDGTVTVEDDPEEDVVEVYDTTAMTRPLYRFTVVGRSHQTDEPTIVKPKETIATGAGTDDRKTIGTLLVTPNILEALADCDIALDLGWSQ